MQKISVTISHRVRVGDSVPVILWLCSPGLGAACSTVHKHHHDFCGDAARAGQWNLDSTTDPRVLSARQEVTAMLPPLPECLAGQRAVLPVPSAAARICGEEKAGRVQLT